jgi:hypothetical protein
MDSRQLLELFALHASVNAAAVEKNPRRTVKSIGTFGPLKEHHPKRIVSVMDCSVRLKAARTCAVLIPLYTIQPRLTVTCTPVLLDVISLVG